jgi:hypothetical protein
LAFRNRARTCERETASGADEFDIRLPNSYIDEVLEKSIGVSVVMRIPSIMATIITKARRARRVVVVIVEE